LKWGVCTNHKQSKEEARWTNKIMEEQARKPQWIFGVRLNVASSSSKETLTRLWPTRVDSGFWVSSLLFLIDSISGTQWRCVRVRAKNVYTQLKWKYWAGDSANDSFYRLVESLEFTHLEICKIGKFQHVKSFKSKTQKCYK
jgi:hypothetical protein